MNKIQSNTQGPLVKFVCGATTCASKEGYLAKISGTETSGRGKVIPCTAITDNPVGVIEEGGAVGAYVVIRLVDPGHTVRAIAGGAISAGDEINSHTDGTVAATGSGARQIIGLALHNAVAGDYVEFIPIRRYYAS